VAAEVAAVVAVAEAAVAVASFPWVLEQPAVRASLLVVQLARPLPFGLVQAWVPWPTVEARHSQSQQVSRLSSAQVVETPG
jgi:hypothetical protein